jgi:hypothetical protein
MATLLDVLKVRIEADPSSLNRGMDQAARSVDQATRRMNSSLATVSASFKTLVGAAGVTALLNFSKRTIDAIGGLGELADQLGVSTKALQAYQYAATQVGLSQEQLQQGLGFLTRKIGEAAEGNDAAIASFNRLSIGVLDASGKVRNTEDILGDVANAIQRIEDPATRARVAFELMGRAGQKFLPFLQQGRQGLSELSGEAERAGAVVDKELIDRFDKASDAMQRWKMQITVRFAEGLDAMLTRLQDPKYRMLLGILGGAAAGGFVAGPGGALLGGSIGLGATLGGQAGEATDKVTELRQELIRLTDLLYKEQTTMPKGGRPTMLAELNRQIRETQDKLHQAMMDAPSSPPPSDGGAPPPSTSGTNPQSQAYKQLINTLETARDSIDQTTAAQLRLRMERELDEKGMPKWTALQIEAAVAIQQETDAKQRRLDLSKQELAAQQQVTQAEKDATDALRDKELAQSEILYNIEFRELPAQQQLLEALKNGNRAYEEEAEYLKIINQLKAQGVAIDEKQIALARELAKKTVDVNRQIDRQKAANDELERFSDRAFDRIGDAMTRMAVEGKEAWSDWRNLAKGVISEVMQEFMKLAVLNPLKNAIFGGNNATLGDINFSKLFGGGGSSFTGSSGGLPGGDPLGWVQRNLKGFPFFADGGRPPVGVPSIVGERGKELFVPDVPGTIVPNNKLGQVGNSGPVFNVDMRGASIEAVARLERLVTKVNGSIESRAIAAVSDARHRGFASA